MAFTYPFDTTAIAISNKLLNEFHTPTNANGVDPYLIVPDATPFYGDSMMVVDVGGDVLVEGTDYYLAYKWPDATEYIGKNVFGTVVLIGSLPVNTVKLTYQTLGGDYVDNRANAVVDGLVSLSSVLSLDWSTAPTSFPVSPHTVELDSLEGMSDVLLELEQLRLAISEPIQAINFDDIADLDIKFLDPTLLKLSELVTAVNNRSQNSIDYTIIINDLNVKIAELEALKVNVQNILDSTDGSSASATTAADEAAASALAADTSADEAAASALAAGASATSILDSIGILPYAALPPPTIDSTGNLADIIAGGTNALGGIINVGPIDLALSKTEADGRSGRSGRYKEDFPTVFSNLLSNSTYYFRAQVNSSGVLVLYSQKGNPDDTVDTVPGNLLGVPVGSHSGGFPSTVLDIRLAKVTTGADGSLPVVTTLYQNSHLLLSNFI